MGFGAKLAPLLVFWALVPLSAGVIQKAQGNRIRKTSPELSLLSATDGLSVIGAALESRGKAHTKGDCSHLVNAVYSRAGFPYSYVSSSDLYAGIEEFHRVQKSQPGDLVVWPGHVGIVVSPSDKTFFSALSTGAGVESYTSPYWKGRGTPRFYRYVKARGMQREEISSPTQLQRAALATREEILAMPTVERTSTDIQPPRVLIINSPKPKADLLTKALLSEIDTDADNLRDVDVFKLARPLILVSKLEARTVKIHGDQGQLAVRITATLSVTGDDINLERRQETRTCALRRHDRKSWEVLFPQDAIYVRSGVAVRAFAHQLALLADADGDARNLREKSQLAKMLNAILVEQ